jgi:hypothetical protein
MDNMDLSEPDVDPEAQEEKLIKEAEQAKRQHQQEKGELLEAVKNEEEFTHESYEWVELGDVELKVKSWIPGESMDAINKFAQADQSGEIPNFSELIEAAKELTEVVRTANVNWQTQAKVNDFWDSYYNEHGSNVIYAAAERVYQPALENMEQRAPESFPGEQNRDGFRSDVPSNGQ